MHRSIRALTEFIFVGDEPRPSDVILIPGASHPQLAEKAAQLYISGYAKYILASGHANKNLPAYPSEADYLRQVALDHGVADAHFICERKASHTFENAAFSLSMLQEMHIPHKRVLLVCKAYHARRALLTYESVFPKDTAFLVASIPDKRGLCKENWTTKAEYIQTVMDEVEKIGKYFKDKII